jgi:hypothetical protein
MIYFFYNQQKKTHKKNPKDEPFSGAKHLRGEIVRNYDLRFTNYD